MLYFSGSHQILQVSPGTKSLYDLAENLAREAKFGAREANSANLLTGEATETHLTRALVQGVQTLNIANYKKDMANPAICEQYIVNSNIENHLQKVINTVIEDHHGKRAIL